MEAFLVDNAELIGALAGLVAIIGSIFVAFRWGKTVFTWVATFAVRRDGPVRPRKTIQIVEHPQRPWWHMGSSGSDPAMQIVSHWYVTNVTDQPVNVLAARMLWPKTSGAVDTKHHDRDIYGRYVVPPGLTTEVSVDFWVKPPVRRKGEEFKATIVLTDQFGNDHKVKNVVFRYT